MSTPVPSFDPFISDPAFGSLFSQPQVAQRFLTELCSASAARPLLRCGLGRSVGDEEDDDDELGHNRNGHRFLVFDLEGLKDLLLRDQLPQGPIQVISQLR